MSLLEKKKVEKKKMPKFIRSDAHKKKRLGTRWKKPNGIHPKMRLKKRGKPVMVNIGYKTPSALQEHSLRSGLKIVEVQTLVALKAIDAKTECVELVGVGFKKKKEMIAYCIENKIEIHNLRNPKGFVENKEKELQLKREKIANRRSKKKTSKTVEKSTKKEEKPSMSAEEEKKQKKKEMDKVLISKK